MRDFADSHADYAGQNTTVLASVEVRRLSCRIPVLLPYSKRKSERSAPAGSGAAQVSVLPPLSINAAAGQPRMRAMSLRRSRSVTSLLPISSPSTATLGRNRKPRADWSARGSSRNLGREGACSKVIRVVLGDDSFLAREGIARVLESVEDVELVEACV